MGRRVYELAGLLPEQVLRTLELTDSFGIHREAVTVSLLADNGSVAFLPDGRLSIVCPKTIPFDNWLNELKSQLQKTGLSGLQKL